MKLFTLLALALTLTASAAETLHIYTWADYLSPEAIQSFEAKHDCRVVVDTFDSNETMFAKLKAGARGYDLIFPTSYMIPLMEAQGMLAALDHAQLKNLANIDPTILAKVHDRSMRHSVPYTLAGAVMAYRKDKLSNVEPTWAQFARPEIQGRMTLLDDMRESIGAALLFLGHSINTRDEAQLAAAQEVLLGWKKNTAKFDNEAYKAGIDSGEFHLVHGYSGDLFQLTQENPKVTLLIPREGIIMGCDEMVIPRASTHSALAHAFIDHLLTPKVAAENMEWMGYLCPNLPAQKLVSPEFLANPAVTIPPEILAKSEIIQDLGPDLAKYSRVWDVVKR